MNPPAMPKMAAGGGRNQAGPASGQPDSLAQVQQEINVFKAEPVSPVLLDFVLCAISGGVAGFLIGWLIV